MNSLMHSQACQAHGERHEAIRERLAEAVELFNAETLPEQRVKLFREIQGLRGRWQNCRAIESAAPIERVGLWGSVDEDFAVGSAFDFCGTVQASEAGSFRRSHG